MKHVYFKNNLLIVTNILEKYQIILIVALLLTQNSCSTAMKKIDLDYFKNNIASEKILDLGQANKKVIDGILLDDLDISTKEKEKKEKGYV